ncbi:hypothetical protein DLAC_06204 [Tieghemostelium lacteum]|uniref:mRNA (guanine-N(7))-methyltransferase n=1 Tax=Tieghemostelium lacteum TaxID=361077 RepID=A0A151ZHW8_TIELA|nr:hypothetical protein DLAC_06204 [Tieghemostelium lacteum]|eukprot:KYQ93507.1 hypothetical protein DLAC_06204 [Tieghemostelium lacteum]
MTTAQLKTPIWQFKAYENWVKTILISELVETGNSLAEFYCGQGLDTGKWERSKIRKYYGFDHAKESLVESETKWLQRKQPYEAEFIEIDLTTDDINEKLREKETPQQTIEFDSVACFEGLQHSFLNQDTANQFIENASNRLKVGGYFFGIMPDSSSIWYKSQKEAATGSGLPTVKSALFNIDFDSDIFDFFGCKYHLSLKDGNTYTENLIHFPSFINLCKNHNLILVEATNLAEFYEENKKNYESKLQQARVLVGKGKIEPAQMDLISLYTTFIFVKEIIEPKLIKP